MIFYAEIAHKNFTTGLRRHENKLFKPTVKFIKLFKIIKDCLELSFNVQLTHSLAWNSNSCINNETLNAIMKLQVDSRKNALKEPMVKKQKPKEKQKRATRERNIKGFLSSCLFRSSASYRKLLRNFMQVPFEVHSAVYGALAETLSYSKSWKGRKGLFWTHRGLGKWPTEFSRYLQSLEWR